MDERRLTKLIYEAASGGNVVRGRPRRMFLDQFGASFRERPGQDPKPAIVYEELNKSRESERCV
jgi:hypothetical protein